MIIELIPAVTYRAGGRRWLTKKAAYRAAAREKLRQRCECDRGDEFTPGETCRLHADSVRYQKLIRRLAFHYARVDSVKPPQSLLLRCAAGCDGDCFHDQCPQLRDKEPRATGRHCPLDIEDRS